MINEQELAEAVERLREGEQVFGLNCDDVYRSMAKDEAFTLAIFEGVHHGDTVFNFDEFFVLRASDLLSEAYRTKLEHEAGL